MAGRSPGIIAWLWLSLLTGCTTVYNPAVGRTETVLSTSIEMVLGNMARAQMGLVSLQVGRVGADEFQRVQRIGERIAAVSDRQDVPYRFGVIREKGLNAFALPGGTIYVYTGLLEKANDDELASVLAHEVGHVAARHAAKHLQADLGFTVLLQIARAAGSAGGSAQVANSLYGLFSNGYSRRDELEADRLGLRYAHRAGFNLEGMVTFFEKLLKEHPEDAMDRAAAWQRTHPLTSDRIEQAKAEIERLKGEKFCPTCGRTFGPKASFCTYNGTPLKQRGDSR